jgi:hypothetical protein
VLLACRCRVSAPAKRRDTEQKNGASFGREDGAN